jgi:hypothetical protein
MDIILRDSKSLAPTCKAGEIWLHSPYDPEKEALRFVLSSLGQARPSQVLLLGPCLDYITPALRSIVPGAKVVSIQYSAFFVGKGKQEPDASWHPGDSASLDSFLDSTMDEDAISGVSVLEWEPAARAFPEEALEAQRAVRSSLDRLNSSVSTVKVFGKRWISNACASFLLVEKAACLRPTSLPIILAAAGPSLNDALASLSRYRGRFMTIAVSSAWAACLNCGIEPDIVVTTDGGFWSRHHLYPLASSKPILAAPLTALPSATLYRAADLLILNQGSFVESELLPAMGPSFPLPPHGTVSGTALQLAARLTEGPIIATGLDLASYGDFAHARPHGFDALLAAGTSRLAPLEATLWSRALEASPEPLPEKPWRSSRALHAYSAALDLDSRRLFGRLYRLSPSPQVLSGFTPLDREGLDSLMAKSTNAYEPQVELLALPPRHRREAFLAAALASWRSRACEAAKEMGRGLLPSSALIAELLRSIDIVDYAAARRAILARGDPLPAARDLAERCDSYLDRLGRRFAP